MSRRRAAAARPRRTLPALLAAAAALACLAAPPPVGPGENTAGSPVEAPAERPAATPPEAARVGDALRRALAEPGERRRLRLYAEAERPDGYLTVEVFGRGVGIWDGRRQFEAAPAEIERAIRAALELGFPAMAPVYGGGARDRPRPAEPAGGGPLRLVAAVEIRAGESAWRVEQLSRGAPHPPLLELVGRLLEPWRAAGEAGRAARDLDDGLARIAGGGLAPETLRLAAHDKPELGEPGEGFLLGLDGARLTVRAFSSDGGYGPERVRRPAAAELRTLAGELAAGSPAGLPVNLFSPRYVDLELEVLGHRLTVQARRFAGMTAATHGAAQDRFDRLLRAVRALAARPAAGPRPGGDEGAGP